MLIAKEIKLQHFRFWGGAENFANRLTQEEFETIEQYLEVVFFEKIPNLVEINDIFWFDQENLLGLIGATEESFWKRKPLRGEE